MSVLEDWIKQYVHWLVTGLAVFTLIGILLLAKGFYAHEMTIREANAAHKVLKQEQDITASQVKDLESQQVVIQKKVDVIIASKALTSDEIRKFFKEHEGVK